MNIQITDTARDELKKILPESKFSEPALRIAVSGIG